MIDFIFVVIATPFNIIRAAVNEATKPIVSHHKNCGNNSDEGSNRPPPPPPPSANSKLYSLLSGTFSRGIAKHAESADGCHCPKNCEDAAGNDECEAMMKNERPILKEPAGPYDKASRKMKKMKKMSEKGTDPDFTSSAPPKE